MPFSYEVKRSKRKTISISVKDGRVIVSAPLLAPKFMIEQMVQQHSEWIEKKLDNPRINLYYDLSKDKVLYLLGKPYYIDLKTECKNAIYVEDGTIHLEGRSINSIENNLKKYLIEIVNLYVVNIKEQLNIDFEVQYKRFHSKWGCCYKNKRLIVMNYLCAGLPKEVIQQVIYHEIAHLKVSNHQKAFYDYLGKLCPEYKKQVKILKQYSI